ncbi:metal-dependent phosphohydrolase [Streptomyces sp. Ru62]|uniref:HD domain-containing protein n=1 Tax=Streptomyces sp. Ru62 TaxID=2080745 RepID=UPI000CDDBD5B|nr:HD domain-containing protein [Streptomyces sp. Ru62]POX63496.1 metal-dependent phosphohydrolase [Streptomyces sp. Ru62]
MQVSFGGAVADSAYAHVRSVLQPAIVNHSVRVWLLADHLGRQHGLEGREREALAVACLFHDAGTADAYDGPQRFEVEGADAAGDFLSEHDWPASLVQKVWEAIALHTSPGIAERMGTLPRLLRLGVLADFGATDLVGADDDGQLSASLARFPRMDIEVVLGDAVVDQALRCPGKAPKSSWPGGLLAARLADPGHTGVSPAF